MKKVRLTMKYEEQYKIIKELVNHGETKHTNLVLDDYSTE